MTEKLEPLGPMMRCPSCGQRFQEAHDVDAHLARLPEDDKALVERLLDTRTDGALFLRKEAADRITQLSAEVERAKSELLDLTTSIWRAEYRIQAPNWQPLPDLVGLISQLDNMYAGVRGQRDEARAQLSAEVERLKEAIAAVYGPSGPRIVKAAINAMKGPTDASE